MIIPTRIAIFLLVQSLAGLFAIHQGGMPERLGAWMLIGATIASVAVIYLFGIPRDRDSVSLFTVDLLLLIGLLVLAVRANRYWPLWLAGLQLLAIGFHAVREIEPDILQPVYNQALGKIAYPMIALLVIGTIRYRQRRSITAERDWSELKW